MIAKVDGKFSNEFYWLSTQCNNADESEKHLHFRALAWKPRNAKSYTILEREITLNDPNISGKVQYYTTRKEGRHLIP